MKIKRIITVAFWVVLGGCVKNGKLGQNPIKEQIDNSFDFKSTYTCPINLNYGRRAYIEIYDVNPVDVNGIKPEGISPVYSAFTSSDGILSGKMELPKYLQNETVYVYSPSVGVPWLTDSKITDSGLSVDVMSSEFPVSKADAPVFTVLSDKLIAGIEASLPEGRNNESKIISHHTSISITEECEIDVIFVHEHTAGTNTFTYFWYPTGTPLTSRSQINAANSAVLFPEMKYNKLKSGQTVRLQYFAGKEWTTRFPAGITVGWMVHQPKVLGANPNAYFTSLPELNPAGKAQTVAFRDEESQMLVFGFEDWFYNRGDKDYNDVLFSVKATPFEAIDDKDFPPLDEGKDTTGEETVSGTLLFEDLYPAEGDYDMNDVVVEYKIIKYFNKFNNTLRILGEYIPKSVPGSAGLVSGFGFIIDNAEIASVTVNTQPYQLDAVQDIILYNSQGEAQPHYEVDIRLSTPVNKDELKAPFNPFIFVGKRNDGREIHLTKMKPTAKADQSGLDEFLKHYITRTNFPFAMNVPVHGFRQVTEKVRIDQEYPDFSEWINNGKLKWWENKIN